MNRGIQSWSINKFYKENGVMETARVLGLTNYRSVYPALKRQIKIVETENETYEAHEAKLLNSVPVIT